MLWSVHVRFALRRPRGARGCLDGRRAFHMAAEPSGPSSLAVGLNGGPRAALRQQPHQRGCEQRKQQHRAQHDLRPRGGRHHEQQADELQAGQGRDAHDAAAASVRQANRHEGEHQPGRQQRRVVAECRAREPARRPSTGRCPRPRGRRRQRPSAAAGRPRGRRRAPRRAPLPRRAQRDAPGRGRAAPRAGRARAGRGARAEGRSRRRDPHVGGATTAPARRRRSPPMRSRRPAPRCRAGTSGRRAPPPARRGGSMPTERLRPGRAPRSDRAARTAAAPRRRRLPGHRAPRPRDARPAAPAPSGAALWAPSPS